MRESVFLRLGGTKKTGEVTVLCTWGGGSIPWGEGGGGWAGDRHIPWYMHKVGTLCFPAAWVECDDTGRRDHPVF